MIRLDLMNDDEVIKWIKRKIASICLVIITLVLLVYSGVVRALDPNLLDNFIVIAVIVYLISIPSIKFFLDKLIFNVDGKRKSQLAKAIRYKHIKK